MKTRKVITFSLLILLLAHAALRWAAVAVLQKLYSSLPAVKRRLATLVVLTRGWLTHRTNNIHQVTMSPQTVYWTISV